MFPTKRNNRYYYIHIHINEYFSYHSRFTSVKNGNTMIFFIAIILRIEISDWNSIRRCIENYMSTRSTGKGLSKTFDFLDNADRLYLQDDESVFGHVFIAFFSLYIHCKLGQLLKKIELNHKFMPIDLLFKYGKV